ncbi:Methyltransferase type 11 [Haliscomenobacter hydrossis DSM 1100]|uniref:Methyltransferase type 11 n=2 Tax=Haliscomenobacter TaxID=2349 RepID=F4KPL8_HALH1|nr:Methyltransferase type 11 [Haliscomenobacter hydrossis DSM 1100]
MVDLNQTQLAFFEKYKPHFQGFINDSNTVVYPVVQGVIVLLPNYAMLANGEEKPMPFDKDRVFRYYNQIEYEQLDDSIVYSDAKKFVDFRPVNKTYLENALKRVSKYIAPTGKYCLDIASGPIGLKEYLELSAGYEWRICIDISINALIQAKKNLGEEKGIFICGDITNIPLQAEVCAAVISQHTLYHVPKNEQETAVRELYRVAKEGACIAIVYNWFYHSLLMNIALLPLQVYRVIRHLLGKFYVKLWPSKPRLYFYPHSYFWFKNLGYGDKLNIYVWRTLNVQFMRLYIHDWLGGQKMLQFFQHLEDRFPKTMGFLGDYPLIVIKK